MKLKSSVFIATSLDGYIAREDGSLDWLDRANETISSGEDFGYQAFMSSVDVLVMGRNSFEKVLTFGEWPYGAKPVIVLSRTGITIPSDIAKTVSATADPPEVLVKHLEKGGAHHLYVDGGQVIQSFLRAGLIDEITITLIPVLLGSGKPLFGHLSHDLELVHLKTQAYEGGFVQNKYHVKAAQSLR